MKKIFFYLLFIPFLSSGQESSNMTLLSNLDLPNLPSRYGAEYSDCWGFRHANGTEIAIIGGIEDIFFVNITSPANPVIIYTHHVQNVAGGTNQSLWRDFKSYQNYIYAAADEGTSGLLVFDLSQVPASVTMVTQTNAFWNRAHNIFIDEQNHRLYGAGTNSVNNGLVILDLANPAAPTLEANVPLNTMGGGYVHDVYVRDNIAYCSHGSLSKIQIYDFNNLPTITVIGSIENYPDAGYNHSSWLNSEGTMLAMCDETHGSDIKLVDVTDPENISANDFHTFYSELLGPDVPGSSIPHNPFILGDLVYISYYHDGVQVFDISDPDNIVSFAYYDTYPDNVDYNDYFGCWGVYPFLQSGNIIASDMTYGLFVLHLTNPPLGITFLSFDAFRENKSVRLKWVVADATFGNTFDVKRSLDGGITFQTIGNVALTEGKSNYEFTDQNLAGSAGYVYRIDFVQSDGTKKSSPIRFVRTDPGEKIFNIVNPVTSSLIVNPLKPVESVNLSVFDTEGRMVWHQYEASLAGASAFALNGIPAGQYVLVMNWEGGSLNQIIQKIN